VFAGVEGDEVLLFCQPVGRQFSIWRENLPNRTDTSGGFFREILIEADEMSEIRRFCVFLDDFVVVGGDL
jgi:hypothetical protein